MPPFDVEEFPTTRYQQSQSQTTQVSRLLESMPWTRRAQERTLELSELPANWDQRGSDPIGQNTRFIAFGLINVLSKLQMPEPHIVPVPGGGLQFEWFSADRELEIEVMADGTIEYLVQQSGEPDPIKTGEIPCSFEYAAIAPIVKWYNEKTLLFADVLPYASN